MYWLFYIIGICPTNVGWTGEPHNGSFRIPGGIQLAFLCNYALRDDILLPTLGFIELPSLRNSLNQTKANH